GSAFLGGDDLHGLAVFEPGRERHHHSIDAGPPAAMTELGVDVVGEVNRGRADRQLDHPRLGREHEDRRLAGVAREHRPQTEALADVALPGEQLAQPGDFVVVTILAASAPFLVAPVRRHAILGEAMHLGGADLDLERLAVVGNDDGVQRAIAVRLGARDVVVVFLGNRLPDAVDHAQHRVAVVDARDDDSQTTQILDLGQGQALTTHLVADADEVLRSTAQFGVDAGPRDLGLQAHQRRLDEVLAFDAPLLELPGEPLVFIGPEKAKRQVLELPLELPQPEAVGQRRQYVEGLAADRGFRHIAIGDMLAQRLQARGEPDEYDLDIDRHRHRHAAQDLDLAFLAAGLVFLRRPVALLEAADLAHAFDESGDFQPPAGLDLAQRNPAGRTEEHRRHLRRWP